MTDNIKNTIFASIRNVVKYKEIITKSLVLPIVITTILIIIQPEKPSAIYLFLSLLIQWTIYTMLTVTIHRIILLGPNSVTDWLLYFPSGREVNFFFHSFLIGLILIPVGLTALIPGIGIFIATILTAYVIGRVSLVFPSIATDDPLAISDSWNSTQNYQIFMLVIVAVFPLVLSIPNLLIAKILNFELYLLTANIFSLIAMVFLVAALSESYRLIEGQFIES